MCKTEAQQEMYVAHTRLECWVGSSPTPSLNNTEGSSTQHWVPVIPGKLSTQAADPSSHTMCSSMPAAYFSRKIKCIV